VVLPHTSGGVSEDTSTVRGEGFSNADDAGDRTAGGYFRKHLRRSGDLAELRDFVHWVLVDGEALSIAVTAVATHVEGGALAVDGLVVGARFIDHTCGVGKLVPA
jgi:hypothetical protein